MEQNLIEKLIDDLGRDNRFNKSEVSSATLGLKDYLDSFGELKKMLDVYNNSFNNEEKQLIIFDIVVYLEFHLIPHFKDLVLILKKFGNVEKEE